MFCKKCGKEILPGAKFCTGCGARAPEISSPQAQVKQDLSAAENLSSCPENGVNNYNNAYNKDSGKKCKGVKKAVIIIITVFVAAFLLALGFGMLYYISDENPLGYITEVFNTDDTAENESTDDDNDNDGGNNDDDKMVDNRKEGGEEDTSGGRGEDESETASDYDYHNEETEKLYIMPDKHSDYKIVVADVTWEEAYEAAMEVPNGHLVTIESQDEMNTITDLIEAQGYEKNIFWIGARRYNNLSDYYWIYEDNKLGNEPITYDLNWLSGEPTFYDEPSDTEEQYVDMFYTSSENRWVWNDTVNDVISVLPYYTEKVAYIIEIEKQQKIKVQKEK